MSKLNKLIKYISYNTPFRN